ncbi:MAG: rRNA pseudouridine synthase [Treponema sp.]|nr:rRNA pseudouridine synthase [Treponema sp.]
MAEEIYLIMNKPAGYVCSAVSDSHKTVYQLLPQQMQSLVQGAKRGHRLHTIGRLDCDTSGLLLFTTDGKFSHCVSSVVSTSSTSSVSKTYRAVLKTQVPADQQADYISRAAQGLTLPPEKKFGEQKAKPAALRFIKDDICKITVHEGKFHEVRRIFRALGNEVAELHRTAIGPLELPEDLSPGQWRPLTEAEKASLYFHQPDC